MPRYAAGMGIPAATSRLTFREMEHSDLDFMAGLLGDADVMRYYARPKTRAEARAWVDWNVGLYRDRGFGLWLIEHGETGQPVGDCGLTPQVVDGVEEIELGYHVHPDFQGRGLATEAAIAVLDYARSTLGRHRIVAIIDPLNTPSKRVAERAGLRKERATLWKDRRVEVFASGPD